MAKKDDKLALGLGKLLGTPAKKPAVEVATSTVADTSTVENEPAKEDIIDSVQDEELREALRKRQLEGRGKPKKGRPHDSRTEGYGTICVKANLEKWEKIKYISLQETLQIKEVLELALDKIIAEYEEEKGTILIKRTSKKGNVFNK